MRLSIYTPYGTLPVKSKVFHVICFKTGNCYIVEVRFQYDYPLLSIARIDRSKAISVVSILFQKVDLLF